MKKLHKPILFLLNIIIALLTIYVLIIGISKPSDIDVKLVFNNISQNTNAYAQLYFADTPTKISEENSIKEEICGSTVNFNLGDLDFRTNFMRIDPIDQQIPYEIQEIQFYDHGKFLFSITGDTILDYTNEINDTTYHTENHILLCYPQNNDSRFILSSELSSKIYNAHIKFSLLPYYLCLMGYLLLGIFIGLGHYENQYISKWKHTLPIGLATIFIFLGILLNYGDVYLEKNFGNVPIGQLIYHLHTPLEGTNTSSFLGLIWLAIFLFVLTFIVNSIIYFFVF